MDFQKIKLHIRQIYPNLRPSEQKVADYILEYTDSARNLLVEEVAEKTGVSQPTVIRFVKAGSRALRILSMR